MKKLFFAILLGAAVTSVSVEAKKAPEMTPMQLQALQSK